MILCRLALIFSIAFSLWFGVLALSYAPILGLLPVFLLLRRGYKEYTTHGTARWAKASELSNTGFPIGEAVERPTLLQGVRALFNPRIDSALACRMLLCGFRNAGMRIAVCVDTVHVAIFAPTGSGKGVSFVVPWLLSNPSSVVVTDIKGELERITAKHRKEKFNHRIVSLKPYREKHESSDGLNPLDFIDKDSDSVIDDCRDLAKAIVIRAGTEHEPHWNDAAESVIANVILYAVVFIEKPSLQHVRSILLDDERLESIAEEMEGSTALMGMVKRAGKKLNSFKDRERASVLTTAHRHTEFLDTLPVIDVTHKSTFNAADLTNTTVYIIVPPEHLEAQRGLVRLWIGTLMRLKVKYAGVPV